MKKAIVLVSGGLDSTTVLAICKSQAYIPYALSFDYGQRHKLELEKAKNVAKKYGAKEHKIAYINLNEFGGSSLTSEDIEVVKRQRVDEIKEEIPSSYVPARNTIFLSLALGYAEIVGAYDIFIGVNSVDYSNYPDCRPEYIKTFESLANLATKAGVEGAKFKIHTPLIDMTKAEIIKTGVALGIDYNDTITCYDPSTSGISCGQCDACLLRLKGFKDAGLEDPIKYKI